MENVLEVALAKLLITSPEDIMTTFVTREGFGCKQLKHSLRTFGTNYVGDLKSDLVYVRLFRSIGKFFQLFCDQNEKYRKVFTPFQDELIKLHEEFMDCQGSLDWYERNSTIACIEAGKIIECYHEALIFDIDNKFIYHYIDVFEKIINEALSKPCKFEKLRNGNCEESEGKYFKAYGVIAFMVLTMLSAVIIVMVAMKKKSSKY